VTAVVDDAEQFVIGKKGPGVGKMLKKDREEQLKREERGVLRHEVEEGEEGWEDVDREGQVVHNNDATGEEKQKQRVLVLEGGFVEWQAVHGEDERLTEAYSKELWKDAY
jgi:hypothetical protein